MNWELKTVSSTVSSVPNVFHMISTRFPQEMWKEKSSNDACLRLILERFPQKGATPFSFYEKYGIKNGKSNCR